MMVSEPGLNKSISSLEKELGFPLFSRIGRHIELTRYGAAYAADVEKYLQQLEAATKKVQSDANATDGRIDIACSASLLKEYLPRLVRAFTQLPGNDRLHFHFQNDYSVHIIERLRRLESDVGFCSMIPNTQGITFLPVQEEELVVIVPPGHPLAGETAIDLARIQPYPFIAYSPSAALYHDIAECLEASHVKPFVVCETVDEAAIAALVSEGFGISLVAKVQAIAQFRVKMLRIAPPVRMRTQYLAFNSCASLTPPVQRFIRFVQTTNFPASSES